MIDRTSPLPAPVLRRVVREGQLFLGSLLGPNDALYRRVVRVVATADPTIAWICVGYALDASLPAAVAADWTGVHLVAALADWTVARPRCRRQRTDHQMRVSNTIIW